MLPAYWISNYIFDIIKLLILSVVAICFIYIYSISVSYAWLVLLLYPFAIVPYTYFFSFLFAAEDAGEKFMLITNFLLGGIISIAVFALWIISYTREAGVAFFWILKFSPMFCMTEGIVDSSSISTLDTDYSNPSTTYSTTDIPVMGGDIMFLCL